MNRYRAAGYHLLITLCVLAVISGLIVFRWFPDFFFIIDGGWQGLRLIMAVGLVIGPLLTLIVYKAGKPGLRFDLTLIGMAQALCLTAGVYVVYSERPTFFVYYDGHFYSASADTYLEFGVTPPDPDRFDGTPAMVYVDLPASPIDEADLRKIYYDDEVPLWTAASYYEPLDRHMTEVLGQAPGEAKIRARDTDASLDRWLERHQGTFDDYAFIPVHSRFRRGYIAIRRIDRSFAGWLEGQPPPIELTLQLQ